MSTTFTTTRRAATTAVLLGAAALVAAPAYAQVAPVDMSGDTTAVQSAEHPTKAQVEHDEASGGATVGGSGQVSKAKIEQLERAMRDSKPVPQTPGGTPVDSDPSSIPVTVLVLLGGGLAAGAAGYTVYRFRHHGPVGAATA